MTAELFVSPAERRRAAVLADLLEGRLDAAEAGQDLQPLVTIAQAIHAAEPAPAREFSTALRARLVQEAAARAGSAQLPAPRAPLQTSGRPRKLRHAVAAATAVAVLGGAGAAAASSRALPGDSLYGLKRGIESVQLSLAGSDLSRGRELLEQADERLAEAEQLTSEDTALPAGTEARVMQALQDMDVALRAGSDELTAVYSDTGDIAALEILDGFVTEQRRRLDALVDRLERSTPASPALLEQADATAELLASLHAEVVALIGTGEPVTSSSPLSGAARDGRASGDGSAVSSDTDQLLRSGPSEPATDDAEQAPPATGRSTSGVLGDVTSTAVPALPDVPAITAPPSLPVDADLDAPELPLCVPVAPLTTC